MFLLDILAYEGEAPEPGHPRYDTAIVDSENATQWMASLAHELTIDQVTHAMNGSYPAKVTFMIDFDQQLWVGHGWHNDQFYLGDYQPAGWTTKEDDPYAYMPDELSAKLRRSGN